MNALCSFKDNFTLSLREHLNFFMYILFCDEPLDIALPRNVSTVFMKPKLRVMKEK